jgi:hypothetical protein
VGKRGELKLTLLDLLVIAGIAVGSFWMGQGIATKWADSIIGSPVPDVAFQVQFGVLSGKDSVSSIEDQQKVVSYQIALAQTSLEVQQIKLAHTSGTSAAGLATEAQESTSLLRELRTRQTGLSSALDNVNLELARDEYDAQLSATRSSSLRRLGVWSIQTTGSLCIFIFLAIIALLLRLRMGRGLHLRAVIWSSLVVLVSLLVTAYAGWVGLMLAVIALLSFSVIGGLRDNVRAR